VNERLTPSQDDMMRCTTYNCQKNKFFIMRHSNHKVDKSVETQRSKLEKPWHKIWTEVEEAKEFYIAESSHQQYLVLGGRNGNAQSSAVGCSDPIRCYG